MDLNIGEEIAALKRMTVGELRVEFANVCGEETNARHKQWLVRRIAWRMQALAEGDISERARKYAAELANDADLRTSAPRKVRPAPAGRTMTTTLRVLVDDRLPMPGTILTREYKQQTLQVRVMDRGFEYEGEVYKSLSAVASGIKTVADELTNQAKESAA